MNIFFVQLFSSFVFGAGFITAMSFLVERVDKRYAGMILASPTTTVLGLFFLSMSIGEEQVVSVIPTLFFPLGCSLFFAVIYVYVSHVMRTYRLKKEREVLFTYILSIVVWGLMITPIIIYRPNNILFGLLLCIGFIFLIKQIIFRLVDHSVHVPVLTYTLEQKV